MYSNRGDTSVFRAMLTCFIMLLATPLAMCILIIAGPAKGWADAFDILGAFYGAIHKAIVGDLGGYDEG